MNPEQIRLVQTSWQQVLPIRVAAADLFYARLFELAPEVRGLFKRDIHVQGAMLMHALDIVVSALERMDEVLPVARELACRHVGYGVRAKHYELVGRALLWTLAQGLGASFTPAVRQAWSEAYRSLAGAMIDAAYGSRRELVD